jgi:hypothetical protein
MHATFLFPPFHFLAMSPTKAIAVGIFFNLVAVVAMERVRHLWKGDLPAFALEAWLWYVTIAVTIVITEFCLIEASLADGFPMYVAIGICIAFVLAVATLNGCWMTGRWPSLAETVWLVALIAVAFIFQYVTANAERDHRDHRTASTQDRDA